MGNEQSQHKMELAGRKCTNPSCHLCYAVKETYCPPENVYEWNSKKPMSKWDKTDVKNYMTSLTYTDTTRNVMKNKISGRNLLLARDPSMLAKALNISVEKAEGLFELLQLQKQKEMQRALGNSNEQIEGGDDEKGTTTGGNNTFMGSYSWKTRGMLYWTVYNVKSWFVAEVSNTIEGMDQQTILQSMDDKVLTGEKIMNMEDGTQLANSLHVNRTVGITIYEAFLKRAAMEGDEIKDDVVLKAKREMYRVRRLPWRKYKFIKLTKKPDCVMGYTNEDGIDRAEMKCGHAIASDTLFHIIRSVVEKNKKAVRILCPVPNCGQEWDWDTCLRIADMNDEEMIKYNTIRANRLTCDKFKNCPYCKCAVQRPAELKRFKVQCGRCTSPSWCFACELSWKKSGDTLCGNKECTLVSSVNNILQTCKMQDCGKVGSSYYYQVPLFRACPNCLTLAEHFDNACKHVTCGQKECKVQYCFRCLGVAKNGVWPCGSYTHACPSAPRQYFE